MNLKTLIAEQYDGNDSEFARQHNQHLTQVKRWIEKDCYIYDNKVYSKPFSCRLHSIVIEEMRGKLTYEVTKFYDYIKACYSGNLALFSRLTGIDYQQARHLRRKDVFVLGGEIYVKIGDLSKKVITPEVKQIVAKMKKCKSFDDLQVLIKECER